MNDPIPPKNLDGTVSARDYMLCWNPHSAEVAMVRHPDRSGVSRPYLCTGFAAWTAWHDLSREDMKKIIFIEAYHLIVADGCDATAVHRALWPFTEYRDGLAGDFPEPGQRQRWSMYRPATAPPIPSETRKEPT